jgi:hypothetical protein
VKICTNLVHRRVASYAAAAVRLTSLHRWLLQLQLSVLVACMGASFWWQSNVTANAFRILIWIHREQLQIKQHASIHAAHEHRNAHIAAAVLKLAAASLLAAWPPWRDGASFP